MKNTNTENIKLENVKKEDTKNNAEHDCICKWCDIKILAYYENWIIIHMSSVLGGVPRKRYCWSLGSLIDFPVELTTAGDFI